MERQSAGGFIWMIPCLFLGVRWKGTLGPWAWEQGWTLMGAEEGGEGDEMR